MTYAIGLIELYVIIKKNIFVCTKFTFSPFTFHPKVCILCLWVTYGMLIGKAELDLSEFVLIREICGR